MELNQKVVNFTLQTDEDKTASLTDYAGQPVILFFYPRANTPGFAVGDRLSRGLPRILFQRTQQCICLILDRRIISANPTIVLFDFGKARQLLAKVATEWCAADEVAHTKLALSHEDIS